MSKVKKENVIFDSACVKEHKILNRSNQEAPYLKDADLKKRSSDASHAKSALSQCIDSKLSDANISHAKDQMQRSSYGFRPYSFLSKPTTIALCLASVLALSAQDISSNDRTISIESLESRVESDLILVTRGKKLRFIQEGVKTRLTFSAGLNNQGGEVNFDVNGATQDGQSPTIDGVPINAVAGNTTFTLYSTGGETTDLNLNNLIAIRGGETGPKPTVSFNFDAQNSNLTLENQISVSKGIVNFNFNQGQATIKNSNDNTVLKLQEGTTNFNFNHDSVVSFGKIEHDPLNNRNGSGVTLFDFKAEKVKLTLQEFIHQDGSVIFNFNGKNAQLNITNRFTSIDGNLHFSLNADNAKVDLIGDIKSVNQNNSSNTTIDFKGDRSSLSLKESDMAPFKFDDLSPSWLDINFEGIEGKIIGSLNDQLRTTITIGENKSGIFTDSISFKTTQADASLEVRFKGTGALHLGGEKNTISTLNNTNEGFGSNDLGPAPENPLSMISLASGSGIGELGARNFRVLEVGKKDQRRLYKGLVGKNFTFQVFVDKNADQDTTKIGGEETMPEGGSASYGYGYADRVIVHNVGDNTQATSSNLAVIIDSTQAQTLRYLGGGTEKKGNIAVATVKNKDDGSALVDFKANQITNGGEVIEVDLVHTETDEKGKTAAGANGYTTYFISRIRSLGADEALKRIVSSALSVNFNLYMVNFNSLNKRMGELRENTKEQGVWARIFGGSQESDLGVGSTTEYMTLQAGYDYGFELAGVKNYAGVALSYLTGTGKANAIERSGVVGGSQSARLDAISSQGAELAFYNSYITDEGIYNDSIAKVSYFSSSFFIDGSPDKSNPKNWAFTLSNEVGYRYLFGEGKYYLDPQVGVGLGYLNSANFESLIRSSSGFNKLSAIQANVLAFRTRVGSSIGKIISESQERKISLYLGAFYEYDFLHNKANEIISGSGVKSTSTPLSSNGRVVLNAGGNFQFSDSARFYFDVQKSFGGKYRTYLQFNFGARYGF